MGLYTYNYPGIGQTVVNVSVAEMQGGSVLVVTSPVINGVLDYKGERSERGERSEKIRKLGRKGGNRKKINNANRFSLL